jgi:parvulin-like peptidyl-prolyl isomerase
MSRRRIFALSIAALSLYASGALAQSGRRARGSGDGREKGGGQEPVNPIEVTLHEFHEDLKLSAGQEPAWDAYVERIRALMSDIARENVQSAKAQTGVLQRVDRIVDVARDRLTAVEDIAISAKSLYARLTPAQQQAADPRLANVIAIALAGNVARSGADRGAPAGKKP